MAFQAVCSLAEDFLDHAFACPDRLEPATLPGVPSVIPVPNMVADHEHWNLVFGIILLLLLALCLKDVGFAGTTKGRQS